MNDAESCPECGSADFEEAPAASPDDPGAAAVRRLPDVVLLVCRECGTAWDAERR